MQDQQSEDSSQHNHRQLVQMADEAWEKGAYREAFKLYQSAFEMKGKVIPKIITRDADIFPIVLTPNKTKNRLSLLFSTVMLSLFSTQAYHYILISSSASLRLKGALIIGCLIYFPMLILTLLMLLNPRGVIVIQAKSIAFCDAFGRFKKIVFQQIDRFSVDGEGFLARIHMILSHKSEKPELISTYSYYGLTNGQIVDLLNQCRVLNT